MSIVEILESQNYDSRSLKKKVHWISPDFNISDWIKDVISWLGLHSYTVYFPLQLQ